MDSASRLPLMLCLAGHDPGGGAGIIADVQAASAQGVHALTLITALTVQDSRDVRGVTPVPAALLQRQIDLLLDDCAIGAIKIGLIGDAAQIPVMAALIQRCGVPVVLDPVLRAGGGHRLVDDALEQALLQELLPRVDLCTPNAAESRRLALHEDGASAAAKLLFLGCRNLLITGGDEQGPGVRNSWYAPDQAVRHWDWPRLPETFHGAGCTLASAIAARLALGEPLALALDRAQRWTHQSLQHAYAIGRGRRIPKRWTDR